MQQLANVQAQAIETAIDQYGEIVLSKNNKNKLIIMSIEEYKNKLLEDEIEKKLSKAEKQIDEGKTVKATEVFKELEEKLCIMEKKIT
jgi:PHD/YefM family antitoxin component YafN of YafNO toxin-antitoxin module